ncbi:SCF ubiquitin ligase complex subunit cdc4, partial [Coemansia spiralis]
MVVDQGPEYADSSSTRAQRVRRPRSQPPVAEAEGDDDGRRGTRVNPYLVRPLAGHTDSVRAVAGHGNIVVSGSYDCTIRVWNAETGECVHRLEGHTSKVYTIVLDPDHHAIFSGSMDGMIRVWNWDTGVCLRILRGHLTLVGLLSLRHGTLVSAGADTTLRVWDHPLRAPAGQPTVQQRPLSNISGDMVPFQPQPVGAVNVLTNHALAA